MTAKSPKITLLDMEAMEQAAECLKVLAHPVRLRMVEMLMQGRYTVGELAEACDIQAHMASEHLRLMKLCGLLTAEKEGRCTYYLIMDRHLEAIVNCIRTRFGS